MGQSLVNIQTSQCQGQCKNPLPCWGGTESLYFQLITCSTICKARNGLPPFLFPFVVFYSKGPFSCFSFSDWGTTGRISGGSRLGKPTSLGQESLPSFPFFTPGLISETTSDGQEWQQGPGPLPHHLKGWARCPVLKTLNKE